jgi:hypothetical protein
LRRSPSAPRRRAHLSSNVRPHRNRPCCCSSGSAPDGVGLRSKVSRVPLRKTAARGNKSGRRRAVHTAELREQSPQRRCVSRRSQAPLPAAFFSSSWCHRRPPFSGLPSTAAAGMTGRTAVSCTLTLLPRSKKSSVARSWCQSAAVAPAQCGLTTRSS